MTTWRKPLIALSTIICASAVLATSALAAPAGQAGGSIRVDPGTQAVPPGAEFQVRLVQDIDVVTTGAQVSIGFDPNVLQLLDVFPGAAYAGTELISGGALADAIANANATGELRCIATFFLPGTGAVDPGEQEFLVLAMQSAAGAAGASPIELFEDACTDGIVATTHVGIYLDENGELFDATVTNGTVTIDPGATAPTPPAAGTATGNTPVAGSTNTPTSGVLGNNERPDTGAATMRVEPAKLSVEKGAQFSFDIKQKVGVGISSASVEVAFETDAVELLAVTPGGDWKNATGASDTALKAAVDEANKTGKLTSLAFLLKSGQSVAAGESTIASLSMRAKDSDATSPITLTRIELLDAAGNSVEATGENGEITVGGGGSNGGGVSMLLIIGIFAGVVAVGSTGFFFWRKRTTWA